MIYTDLTFKVPVESEDYQDCSDFVVNSIESIIQSAMDTGTNQIIINTNLKYGIPMENVNKIAGPFIEAWACEIFSITLDVASRVIIFPFVAGHSSWQES